MDIQTISLKNDGHKRLVKITVDDQLFKLLILGEQAEVSFPIPEQAGRELKLSFLPELGEEDGGR